MCRVGTDTTLFKQLVRCLALLDAMPPVWPHMLTIAHKQTTCLVVLAMQHMVRCLDVGMPSVFGFYKVWEPWRFGFDGQDVFESPQLGIAYFALWTKAPLRFYTYSIIHLKTHVRKTVAILSICSRRKHSNNYNPIHRKATAPLRNSRMQLAFDVKPTALPLTMPIMLPEAIPPIRLPNPTPRPIPWYPYGVS